MRIETIKQYIAEDGEVFSTEEECMEYEETLRLTQCEDLKMLDKNLNFTNDIDKVVHLQILSLNKLAQIKKSFAKFGYYSVPTETGCFTYDYGFDDWVNIDDEIEKLREIKTQFELPIYKRLCPYGYVDCIYDPAYIKNEYPNWYKELGYPTTCQCKDGENYDSEDK